MTQQENSTTPSVTQRRGRSIAMTLVELDEFLTASRTCRFATAGPNGPHISPLWFVWHEGAFWISSLVRSQRWFDLQNDPRVAIIVDDGDTYGELRGVEASGTVEIVGEVPRIGSPHPTLDLVEKLIQVKYFPGKEHQSDGRHAWLRMAPTKIVSWDFNKLPEDRRRTT